VPLLPWEACNLGSINVSNFVKAGGIDYKRLAGIIQDAVHFLDNVIDANKYPVEKIEQIVKRNRKVGLGIMGFADLLIQLGIKYGSENSFEIADEVMGFIEEEAHRTSEQLAQQRGVFPNFEGSIYDGKSRLRNATLTSIAPTGTISIIAGCSSGIETIFGVVFRREILEGHIFLDINPHFEEVAREEGFYSTELMEKIADQGIITNLTEVPEEVREVFVTALEVSPEEHVKMQAVFQKYVDNAVSKTVNLPQNATVKDVEKIFRLAYELNCKGITVYRYGSKEHQVLSIGKIPNSKEQENLIQENRCPECGGNSLIRHARCSLCKNCGASSCLL
jgi:ribonucleoside-diphosphate reductase alpha chain